jgi:prepilin-type N-terminal cleavage/methylation domain-containing protein
MKQSSKAFTLIELLVVIAIIAILAAILFPVFAQAKKAAKQSVSISNLKQIGTSLQIYLADNDDIQVPSKSSDATTPIRTERNWKMLSAPYAKSRDLFRDPLNNAARFLDAQSDPAYATLYGYKVLPESERFQRGYALTNLFYLMHKWDDLGLSPTMLENTAQTMQIVEQKRPWPEAGPYLDWKMNEDETPAYPGGIGAGWTWGGGKRDDKAMVVTFHDSHAKIQTVGSICGKPSEVNLWGYQRDKLATPDYYIAGATLEWLDTYCQTKPAGF